MVISKDVLSYLNRSSKEIENIEKNIELMNPVNVLKRGYSITFMNGKVLKSIGDVREGDLLETILPDGDITSVTKKINKTE